MKGTHWDLDLGGVFTGLAHPETLHSVLVKANCTLMRLCQDHAFPCVLSLHILY